MIRGSSLILNSRPSDRSLSESSSARRASASDVHRPELQHGELAAVLADPGLAEDRRTRTCEPHAGRDDEEDRRRQQECDASDRTVDHRLDQPPDAGELRLFHVQQGQSGHRPDVQPWPGHLDQPGRDDQIGAGALQFPRQPPQPGRFELGRGGDRHGVGAGVPDGRGDVVQAAEQRDRVMAQLRSVAGCEAGADHTHPAIGFLAQPRQQVDHRVLAANGQDVVNAPIGLAQRVQPPPGGPPPQEAQPHRHRQREDDVAASDLRLGRVGGEADRRGQRQECVTDSLELLRPETDHPIVVRTCQCGGGDPGERQQDAEGEIVRRTRQ